MREGNMLSRTLGNGDWDCLQLSRSPGKLNRSGLKEIHSSHAGLMYGYVWCLTADQDHARNQLSVWMSHCGLLMDADSGFLLFPGRFLINEVTAGSRLQERRRNQQKKTHGVFSSGEGERVSSMTSFQQVGVSLEFYLNGNCFSTGREVIYGRFNLVKQAQKKLC